MLCIGLQLIINNILAHNDKWKLTFENVYEQTKALAWEVLYNV